jgi:hypothetical protein
MKKKESITTHIIQNEAWQVYNVKRNKSKTSITMNLQHQTNIIQPPYPVEIKNFINKWSRQ